MLTVLNYRTKQYGIPAGIAADQHAATELGRLYLARRITVAMREAGERYLALYEEAMSAIKAPIGFRKGDPAGHGGDHVSMEYVEWAIAVVAEWEVFKSPAPIVQAVVIEGKPVGTMIEQLRSALAVLAKRFGVEAVIA